MTRLSDFDLGTSQEHTFTIAVQDEKTDTRSTVLIGAKGKHRATGKAVLFDRDALAYVRKPGNQLVHVRAPQFDLDQGEAVTVKITEPVKSYFPVLVYDQGDLGGEPIGQAQVRYLSHDGERRLLIDADGKTYAGRTDKKPGVVAIEDPAPAATPVQPAKPRKGAKARSSS